MSLEEEDREFNTPNLKVGELIQELFNLYPDLESFSFSYQDGRAFVLINNLPLPLTPEERMSWLIEANLNDSSYFEISRSLSILTSWFHSKVSFTRTGVVYEA